MLGTHGLEKRRGRGKKCVDQSESLIYFFCVVVRDDTDGRKIVGRGCVAVGVKQ